MTWIWRIGWMITTITTITTTIAQWKKKMKDPNLSIVCLIKNLNEIQMNFFKINKEISIISLKVPLKPTISGKTCSIRMTWILVPTQSIPICILLVLLQLKNTLKIVFPRATRYPVKRRSSRISTFPLATLINSRRDRLHLLNSKWTILLRNHTIL